MRVTCLLILSLVFCSTIAHSTIAHADAVVHEYRLSNGLRLLVKEDHRAPVVVSQVWYEVGSSDEEVRVEQGPPPEELALAKQHLIGSFPLQLDSNQKIVDTLAMIGFHHLPLDYLARFPARVVTRSPWPALACVPSGR